MLLRYLDLVSLLLVTTLTQEVEGVGCVAEIVTCGWRSLDDNHTQPQCLALRDLPSLPLSSIACMSRAEEV